MVTSHSSIKQMRFSWRLNTSSKARLNSPCWKQHSFWPQIWETRFLLIFSRLLHPIKLLFERQVHKTKHSTIRLNSNRFSFTRAHDESPEWQKHKQNRKFWVEINMRKSQINASIAAKNQGISRSAEEIRYFRHFSSFSIANVPIQWKSINGLRHHELSHHL